MKNTYYRGNVFEPTDAEVVVFIAEHPEVCLRYIGTNGKIDMDGVKNEMSKSRKQQVIDKYIDKIKQLNGKSDRRYYIRMKDESKKDGRVTLKAPTMEELCEKIYVWVTEHESTPEKTVITLASLHDEFLNHMKATSWSEATQVRNNSVWRNYYEGSSITKIPIDIIRLKDLREWAYGLIREHDLTKKEWRNVATWMKQMMEYAEEQEYIQKNYYRILKIKNENVFRQIDEKEDENRVLSPNGEMALYKVCLDYYESQHYPVNRFLPLAIIMLFQLGIRPCELCTLRFDDIVNGRITIKRYYSEKADAIRERRGKAGHKQRKIPLTTLALEIIELIRQEQIAEGVKDFGYLFITNNNMRSFYNRLRKTFPMLCREAGIPRNAPYAGRRTFISSLIDEQVNIRTIQNYVGHNDARTTLNNYCFDRNKFERAESLENARLGLSLGTISTAVPIVPIS